jgi:hypothetical protein
VPTFSVVIRAYRAADTVAAAVESALEQTVPPHEVIVVDDGSPDDTVRVLGPYLDRVVLVRKEHGGGASAMNAGALAATGDFVAVLDADDTYLPERIEALGEAASARPDLDVLMTDASVEVDDQVVARYSEMAAFAAEEQRLAILDRCFVVWPAVRRSRFLEVGGYDESLRTTHDWDCHVRLLFAGAQAGCVDVPLYRYRITTGSLSDDPVAKRRDAVRVLERAAQLPLTQEERRVLELSLWQKRRDAALVATDLALLRRAPDARRRALAIAVAGHVRPRTRAKALFAAAAPAVAARLLEARERQTGSSRLQRSYQARGR